jgi:peptidoglycan/xylan/chitin deacetylase (PgdA/CDA1 family)
MRGVISRLPPPTGRFLDWLKYWVVRLTGCGVKSSEVDELLRRAFPDRPLSLVDLQKQCRAPVYRVAALDGPAATGLLKQLAADYVVTLGVPFSALKGEALAGAFLRARYDAPKDIEALIRSGTSCEVFIDRMLPDGSVAAVARTEIPLHPKETIESLHTKVEMAAPDVLVGAMSAIAAGELPLGPVNRNAGTDVVTHIREREPWRRRFYQGSKLLLYGFLYATRIYRLLMATRFLFGGGPVHVLAYHRVNDVTKDSLTVGVREFAEQLLFLRKHYNFVSTMSILRWLHGGEKLPPNSLAIHFDDCYRDVFTNGGRLLSAIGSPACAFVSTGFLDTDRQFEHDLQKCPFRLPKFLAADLKAMIADGFEIGAHTVNHVNLGECTLDEARWEVKQSKLDLERILGMRIELFAFPFGRRNNMTPDVLKVIEEMGFVALFSAFGGSISSKSNSFNLSRVGMSGQFSVLEMLFEVEGLTPGAIFRTRSRTPYHT